MNNDKELPEDIIEGNKLIAEFMGAKITQEYSINTDYEQDGLLFYYPSVPLIENGKPKLDKKGKQIIVETSPAIYRNISSNAIKYHSSWDWLMPACYKFDTIKISLRAKKRRIEYERCCDTIDDAVTLYEILPVFEALVSGIKWYNQNSKL